jgi:hypothetical protein
MLNAGVSAAVVPHVRLTGHPVVAIATDRLTGKGPFAAEERHYCRSNEQASCGDSKEARHVGPPSRAR